MKDTSNMERIFWVSPNFNHYKKRLLTHLARYDEISLEILIGQTRTSEGHRRDKDEGEYTLSELNIPKNKFAIHLKVYWTLFKKIWSETPDVLLFPLERKFLPLILWVRFLKVFKPFQLVSYNHPVLPSKKHNKASDQDIRKTKSLFKIYDRIIFYTEFARDWALEQKMLPARKAYYANNTLDTQTIWKTSSFRVNTQKPYRLLFIGRLIESKCVDICLQYYAALKKRNPDIQLTIIGDGPLSNIVKTAASSDPDIKLCGALIDETDIAQEMHEAHLVFIPGETGLSIVHAFAYGKPYATLDLPHLKHGPELSYLQNGSNGLWLSGNEEEDILRIETLLNSPDNYVEMCKNAFETAENLSVENWCLQIIEAFKGHRSQ